jgi:hypothetical protein
VLISQFLLILYFATLVFGFVIEDITLFRKPVGKDFDRQCTITRAEVQEAKIMYIIKCGTVSIFGVVAGLEEIV